MANLFSFFSGSQTWEFLFIENEETCGDDEIAFCCCVIIAKNNKWKIIFFAIPWCIVKWASMMNYAGTKTGNPLASIQADNVSWMNKKKANIESCCKICLEGKLNETKNRIATYTHCITCLCVVGSMPKRNKHTYSGNKHYQMQFNFTFTQMISATMFIHILLDMRIRWVYTCHCRCLDGNNSHA